MAVILDGQAVRRTPPGVLAGRKEDLKDRLEEAGVEVQRDVDQA
jgi:hypothetical protein